MKKDDREAGLGCLSILVIIGAIVGGRYTSFPVWIWIAIPVAVIGVLVWLDQALGRREQGRQSNTSAQTKTTQNSERPAPTASGAASNHQPSGSPLANYKRALAYLDSCGSFDERKLRETNRIAGGLLSESDIRMLIGQAQMIMPTAGEPGGMEYVKGQVRQNLATLVQMADKMGLR